MRRWGRVIAALTAIFVLATTVGAAASVNVPTQVREVQSSSETVRDRAITDLRSCVSRTGTLDVYFLVDNSLSLYAADDGGTDPDKLRADILANTVAQLGQLSDGPNPVEVSYSLGYFSISHATTIPWTELTAENSAEQAARVANDVRSAETGPVRPSGTHWDVGLEAAQAELQQRGASSAGCQTLIWFTDGGISYGAGNNDETFQALADLCGRPVINNAGKEISPSPAAGTGVLHQMRQSGVSVFGVLFSKTQNERERAQRDYLAPLIEGVGPVADQTRECGTGAIGPNETGGEIVVAADTDSLAREFMLLGAFLAGADDSTGIAADGSFTVDPGVSQFVIIAPNAAGISLQGPTGTLAASDPGLTTQISSNTAQLTVTPQSREDFGTWKLNGVDAASATLLLFGGLTITPDPSNELTLGENAKIGVSLNTVNPDVLSVEDYKFTLEVRQESRGGADDSSAGSQETLLGTLSSDAIASGVNFVTITPIAGDALVRLWFVAVDVETALNGLSLTEVRAFQEIEALVPGNYASVSPTSLEMSTLTGVRKPATGTLTLSGPAEAERAQVCFPGGVSPKITSDTVDRADTWTWVSSIGGKPVDECVTVERGQTIDVELSAANSVSAVSKVSGFIPVTLVAADEASSLEQNIDFTFESQRNINPLIYWLVLALLVLLGVLLPLAVLYLINLLTSKVQHGDRVLRAVFDAQLGLDENTVLVRPKPGAELEPLGKLSRPEELFDILPPKGDAPVIADNAAGTFKRIVPLVPFRAPWFELEAPGDRLVFTGKLPASGHSRRYKDHARAVVSGEVAQNWVVLVRDDDLRSAEKTVLATLVVFAQRNGNTAQTLQRRLLEVEREVRLAAKLRALRGELRSQSGETGTTGPNTPGTGPTPPPPPPPPPGSTGSNGAPPPPSRMAAPRATPPGPRTSPAPGNQSPSPATGGGSAPPPPPPPGRRPPSNI